MHPDAPTVYLPPVPEPDPPPRHRLRRIAVAWLWALAFAALATVSGALVLFTWAVYRAT